MSKIEVNEISKTSTGSEITISSPIAMDSPIKVKSYDTAGIAALTPSTGQLIYDSDNSTLKVYTGSAWEAVGGASDPLEVDTINAATSGGPISLGSELKLKNQTTSQINALSGMSAGETVYDSDLGTIKIYNGVSWAEMSPSTYQFQVQYLVIGGGGAGSHQHGGGGGAGGYRSSYGTEASGGGGTTESTITITPAGTYAVEVGAGGASTAGQGSSEWASNSASGDDSLFHTITSKGGGGGGQWNGHAGAAGGSGGGGATHNSVGGAGEPNQGYAGGRGSNVSNHFAGGGGGAGAVGVDGANNKAGNGGIGVASTITGASVTRAGGGGGGSYTGGAGNTGWRGLGGDGGGGDGGVNNGGQNELVTADNGTVNTGGGGGGIGPYATAFTNGAGGSGVVILRYPNNWTIAVGTGLVWSGTEGAAGTDKYAVITDGTGTVSWSAS